MAVTEDNPAIHAEPGASQCVSPTTAEYASFVTSTNSNTLRNVQASQDYKSTCSNSQLAKYQDHSKNSTSKGQMTRDNEPDRTVPYTASNFILADPPKFSTPLPPPFTPRPRLPPRFRSLEVERQTLEVREVMYEIRELARRNGWDGQTSESSPEKKHNLQGRGLGSQWRESGIPAPVRRNGSANSEDRSGKIEQKHVRLAMAQGDEPSCYKDGLDQNSEQVGVNLPTTRRLVYSPSRLEEQSMAACEYFNLNPGAGPSTSVFSKKEGWECSGPRNQLRRNTGEGSTTGQRAMNTYVNHDTTQLIQEIVKRPVPIKMSEGTASPRLSVPGRISNTAATSPDNGMLGTPPRTRKLMEIEMEHLRHSLRKSIGSLGSANFATLATERFSPVQQTPLKLGPENSVRRYAEDEHIEGTKLQTVECGKEHMKSIGATDKSPATNPKHGIMKKRRSELSLITPTRTSLLREQLRNTIRNGATVQATACKARAAQDSLGYKLKPRESTVERQQDSSHTPLVATRSALAPKRSTPNLPVKAVRKSPDEKVPGTTLSKTNSRTRALLPKKSMPSMPVTPTRSSLLRQQLTASVRSKSVSLQQIDKDRREVNTQRARESLRPGEATTSSQEASECQMWNQSKQSGLWSRPQNGTKPKTRVAEAQDISDLIKRLNAGSPPKHLQRQSSNALEHNITMRKARDSRTLARNLHKFDDEHNYVVGGPHATWEGEVIYSPSKQCQDSLDSKINALKRG